MMGSKTNKWFNRKFVNAALSQQIPARTMMKTGQERSPTENQVGLPPEKQIKRFIIEESFVDGDDEVL